MMRMLAVGAFRSSLLLAFAAAGVVAMPGQAIAAPAGCSAVAGPSVNGGSATCTSGKGKVEVVLKCAVPGSDTVKSVTGPRVGVGATSSQNCPAGTVRQGVLWQSFDFQD